MDRETIAETGPAIGSVSSTGLEMDVVTAADGFKWLTASESNAEKNAEKRSEVIVNSGRGNSNFDAPLSDERVERLKILEELRRAQFNASKVLAPSTTFPPNESEYNLVSNDLQSLQNHLLLAEEPDFSSDSENDEEEVNELIRAAQQALRDDSNSEFSTDDEEPDSCTPIRIQEKIPAFQPS